MERLPRFFLKAEHVQINGLSESAATMPNRQHLLSSTTNQNAIIQIARLPSVIRIDILCLKNPK